MAMALPALAIGSLAATAIGGGVSAYGSIQGGRAQQAMYNYQAGVANVNSTLAKQDANYALASGEVDAQNVGLRGRSQIGATKVGFGAGNVAGASTQRVVGSETEIAQQNQGVTRFNAAKRAYGFNVQAAEDTAQGTAYTSAGINSRTAGNINAASTILSTIGSVSSKWLSGSQSGVFGGSGGSGGGGYGDYDPDALLYSQGS